MADKTVFIERKDNIVHVILNRPHIMNAMSKELIVELGAAVEEVGQDADARVVILKGAGDHFCSGADMSLLGEEQSPTQRLEGMKGVGRIVHRIREIPQPVIVALKGVAVGGGANLALAGDFVIAADDARFCEIFVQIGLIMDYGGHYYLPRLVGMAKARELAMLGNEVSGREAAEIGLIYKAVPVEKLEAETEALARNLAQKAPIALALIKEGLEKSLDMTLKQSLNWEAAHQSIALQNPEHKAIVQAFLDAKKMK